MKKNCRGMMLQIAPIEEKLHSGPEAFQRFKSLAGRLMSVPKAEIEAVEAQEQKSKERR